MNIILLGPPGAGKGTQSDYLRDKYNLAKLATGDMLREAAASGSPLGKQIQSIMEAGQLCPDEIMIDLIRNCINAPESANGFILDGFPRTIAQAEALDEMLEKEQKSLDHVVELAVDDAILVKRISGRFSCAKCGAGYHDEFKQPEEEGVCDNCGSEEFKRRSDDNAETVAKRLEQYHAMTAPLVAYYQKQGVLKSVDGMAPIMDVTKAIEAILENKSAA
ncbi:MAG: adenylate kinase [Rickettsiales bacterium]|nr:adenylate kinase [Rickettsiales bacterium]